MSCMDFEKSISAMVDGELHGSELDKVQAHIHVCENCQSTMRATQAVKNLVSNRIHREVAPVHLRARIRRELDKESASSVFLSRLVRIFTYKPIPAYATVVVVLLVLGFGLGRFTTLHFSGSPIALERGESGHTITLEGKLVCINCALHGSEGHPVYCKEHNHVLGLRLADGSIWSILEDEQAEKLAARYADMNKLVTIQGLVFPEAKYIELRKFKLS